MEPKQLSQELREGKNPNMSRRRAIIGLSRLGGSMGQLVTLYQTGIVGHLPDPPGQQLFDADRVDASNYAYSRFNSPDGSIMVANYAITGWLAAAGGLDRARRNPLLTNCNGHQARVGRSNFPRVSSWGVEWEQSVLWVLPGGDSLLVRVVSARSARNCYGCSHPARTPRQEHRSRR